MSTSLPKEETGRWQIRIAIRLLELGEDKLQNRSQQTREQAGLGARIPGRVATFFLAGLLCLEQLHNGQAFNRCNFSPAGQQEELLSVEFLPVTRHRNPTRRGNNIGDSSRGDPHIPPRPQIAPRKLRSHCARLCLR